MAGVTTSRKFPASAGAFRATLAGPQNAFVAKFDPAGTAVYATVLGGEGIDSATAIAADDSGNAYVAGNTTSAGFPVTPGAYQPTRNGSQNGFVIKLDPGGASLVYGTYLGGGSESVSAVAVDGAGNVHLAGKTSSRTFPLTAGAYQTARRLTDAFVVKLDPAGAKLVYSTLFGGNGTDSANALALDPAGSVWIAGQTDSPDLPLTKDAAQSRFGGGDADGFVAKLDAKGAALLYASYLGGSKRDVANAVAMDAAGNVFVAGETVSQDFPVSGEALQPAYGGGPSDAFILALDGKTLARRYVTYQGGSGDDRATALAAASNGGAFVAGYTNSGNFPATPDALQPALAPGGMDAFLTRWSADGALEYSTYLGGSGSVANEEALDVAVDGAGNVYVTGRTYSLNFPVTDGAVERSHPSGASGDAFVTKIAPDGKSLVFSTYLGGGGEDSGVGIVVDSGGNVYVAGTTASADFPTTAGAWQTTLRASSSAFVAKLSADGSSLIYSTLLSGMAQNSAAAMAVDTDGNTYLAGSTTASNFPTTEGALQTAHAGGIFDAFVSKISADGSRLVYSTLLGGEDRDYAFAIAVDSGGNAYVTGSTTSKSFPVTPGALQTAHAGGGTDAFVVKLDPAGAKLLFSTFLGGSGADEGHRVVADSTGSTYVTGTTGSPDFPASAEAYQKTHSASAAFVSRLNPAGSVLLYSTFLGGGSGDSGNGLAVDSAGNTYVAGCVGSRGFPVSQDALQKTHGDGYWDAFVTKLDAVGKTLLFSTYLGGNGEDRISALALDASGNACMAGYTSSANWPVTAGVFQPRLAGPRNGFVAKVDFTKATPIPAISRVVNAATEAELVAPGSVIAILGKDLSTGTAEFAKPLDKLAGSLPTQLAGTMVTYVSGADKRSLPLFSVSPEKIVAQMPFAAQGIVQVTVTAGGRDSQWANARLAEPAIGIFSVVKTDLTPITRESPLRPGDTMVVTVTGAGRTDPAVATGAPAPGEIAVTVRGQPYVQIAQPGASARCDIQSFTLVPGTVGIARARLRIPTSVSSDNLEWDLTMNGGAESNKVRVFVYAPAP